jgi:peptide/nickel transport system substrate-binding protein
MRIHPHLRASSLASFVALCFAFAPSSELRAQTKPKTITVAHGVDLESLNPYWHNTTANYAVWRHFLEPLAEYDFVKRRYVGILAESWSGSEKGWTFKLHRNVKFHNGADMTAADVIYSLKRSMDPKLSRQISLGRIIQSLQAPDPYTVAITTTKPVVSLLEYLDNAYILSEAAAKESGDNATFGKKPAGTGPFKFVEWVRGERVVAEKNPQYWRGARNIDRIIWKPVAEDAARVALLESGQADLIANVPPHETDRLKANSTVRLEDVRSARIIFLLLDPAHKPLDNKLVRQAIHYAIDKDALVKYVLDGKAHRLDGFFGAPWVRR